MTEAESALMKELPHDSILEWCDVSKLHSNRVTHHSPSIITVLEQEVVEQPDEEAKEEIAAPQSEEAEDFRYIEDDAVFSDAEE